MPARAGLFKWYRDRVKRSLHGVEWVQRYRDVFCRYAFTLWPLRIIDSDQSVDSSGMDASR